MQSSLYGTSFYHQNEQVPCILEFRLELSLYYICSSMGRELSVNCPFCGHLNDKVIDSRESKEGDAIRRRRECLACERRFTTYERIDEIPYMAIKKDGRREKFDRPKVLGVLLKAGE